MRGGGRETPCTIILLFKFTVNIDFDRVKLKILKLFIYKI
jgi:hypothetical protein